MKFDVEGCECHCLKSAKALFERHTVNYVFIETDRAASSNCGCSPQFFVDFFNHNGKIDVGVVDVATCTRFPLSSSSCGEVVGSASL